MSPPLPASPIETSSRRHIVCLGDVMIDIVATLPGPLALGSDVHAPIRYIPGGSAANTAAWLAACGAPVTLAGRVGNDAIGAQAHFDLGERGIIDRLATDRDLATGTCIVLVDADGERTMIPDPGANIGFAEADLDPEDYTSDGHLHVSGYALLGAARPAALTALRWARAAGMTISIDTASAAPLAEAGAAQFADWIGADLLIFANRAEAEVLTGIAEPERAARALSDRFGYAAVKAGADGAYWSGRSGDVLHQPAAPVARVVDTTGAGDAFAAAFLSAISVGHDPTTALQHGCRLAAVACTQIGGRPTDEPGAVARHIAGK